MDVFTIFSEVYQALDQYIASHGTPPREICLPPALYTQLMEFQSEQAIDSDLEYPCYFYLPSDYGEIPVSLGDQLADNSIVLQ
ncbi:MAG: hypothetical protein JST20_10630 [Bacteroidetes bacterium]|nr:hypothetical protein [Bacteroidota bacterium]